MNEEASSFRAELENTVERSSDDTKNLPMETLHLTRLFFRTFFHPLITPTPNFSLKERESWLVKLVDFTPNVLDNTML